VDAELRELVGKWRTASRLAAEDLFGLIKDRVAGMGGAKAWRESRKRQRGGGGFYGGFGDDEQRPGRDRGEDQEGEEEDEGSGSETQKMEEEEEEESEETVSFEGMRADTSRLATLMLFAGVHDDYDAQESQH
jgi:hypothetical protein